MEENNRIIEKVESNLEYLKKSEETLKNLEELYAVINEIKRVESDGE